MVQRVSGNADSYKRINAALDPQSCCAVRDFQNAAPVLEAKRPPVMSNEDVIAPIAHLLCSSSPSAIAFRVAKTIVLSLEGKAFWHFAHVGKEILKRLQPRFANRDTSSAVIEEVFVVGVCASRLHSLPARVSAGVRHAVNKSLFVFDAATRAYSPLFEMVAAHRGSISAYAKAHPVGSGMLSRFVQNSKSVMNFAGPIYSLPGAHKGSSLGAVC